MKYIGEILPVDGFHVRLNVSLPQHYQASLYHLYQPLIGIEAVHLYEFFVCEARLTEGLSISRQTHHTLMNHLNISLHAIYEARLKLEAMGLLRTYKHEDRSGKLYTYQIIPPFNPRQFFKDIMLTDLLERHVGSRRFAQMKQYYVKTVNETKGENVTAAFHEVFETHVPNEAVITPVEDEEVQAEIQLEPIDFNLLTKVLEQRNIAATQVLTETNRRIITQLANLYNLASYELENALLWALTDENELDVEQFKAACHDFVKTKTNVTPVKLTLRRNEAKQVKVKQEEPKSQMDRLVQRLESISPKQLLEDLSDGNHAPEQDLKMISDIMTKQGLTTPVMNVLIHFSMLQTNMMLSRNYLEKVAGHWSRAKLKTAREAMDFALKQVAPKAKNKSNYRKKNQGKQEVIPDWFNNRNEETGNKQETGTSKVDREVEKEMQAILKKYSRQ